MTHPNNDEAVTPGEGSSSSSATKWIGIVIALFIPVFMIVMVGLTNISALHDPKPRDMPISLVGSSSLTSPVAKALNADASGSFSFTTTTSTRDAVAQIKRHGSVGAIVLGNPVEVYVASGLGVGQANLVDSLATKIAASTHATVHKVDLAPTVSGDATGTVLYYLLLIGTLGGYLTMTVLLGAIPKMRLRNRFATAAIVGIAVPLLHLTVASLFFGTMGLSLGSLLALVSMASLYVFTVACITIAFNQFLGPFAVLGVITTVVLLNFPSSGGSISAALLPGFWQGIHSIWIGSGALDALQSILYFGGEGALGGVLRVLVWLTITVAVSAGLHFLSLRRSHGPLRNQEQATDVAIAAATID